MATNAQNLQNYLSTWDNYREIWEINKDMFIKRYQNLNPQVASFDADIARSVSIIMMEIIEHTVVHFSTSIDLILLNNFSLKWLFYSLMMILKRDKLTLPGAFYLCYDQG